VAEPVPPHQRALPVMAEAGVVKDLDHWPSTASPLCDPVVVCEQGLPKCASRHVFGSADAVHDTSDLV